MNRLEIVDRIKKNVFDENNDTFSNETIIDYLNEGIDRMKQIVNDLGGMGHLVSDTQTPTYLPPMYHHLIAVYSTSRCFAQDERYYQATTFMNEFETKLEELKVRVESGEIIILEEYDGDDGGDFNYEAEYVVDNYYPKRSGRMM